MSDSAGHLPPLGAAAKSLVQRLLAMGENRLELLVLEVQEERERILKAALLALGMAAFGLLAGIALTVAIAALFWQRSPVVAMLVLAGLYAAIAALLYLRFARLQRDWHTLSATLEQLRKDRQCLDQKLT
jgi:uncharacterized membrane protein YqjE